jgi:hypothetical protein
MRSCFIGRGHAVNITEKYRLTAVFFYCIVGIKTRRKKKCRKSISKKISNYFSCFSKFKLERDTIMAALRTVPFRRGDRERRKEYG